MASRQFVLETGEYINADDNSREFVLESGFYFNEEEAAATISLPPHQPHPMRHHLVR